MRAPRHAIVAAAAGGEGIWVGRIIPRVEFLDSGRGEGMVGRTVVWYVIFLIFRGVDQSGELV